MKRTPFCVQRFGVSTKIRFPQYRHTRDRPTFVVWLMVSIFLNDLAFEARAFQRSTENLENGLVFFRAGQTLEVLCRLHANLQVLNNCSARNLTFYRDDKLIDDGFVSVVNATTSKLRIDNSSEFVSTIVCALPIACTSLNETAIRKSALSVNNGTEVYAFRTYAIAGDVPNGVQNFACKSYEFTFLKCEWRKTDEDILYRTKETLSYHSTDPTHSGSEYVCDNNGTTAKVSEKFQNLKLKIRKFEIYTFNWPVTSQNFCVWFLNGSTPHRYERDFENITVKLVRQNQFGNITQLFNIHHDARIVPPRPSNMTLLSSTPASMYFKFYIGEMRHFRRPLVYRVDHRWSASGSWTAAIYSSTNLTTDTDGFVFVNITELIPNKKINFRVAMKTEVADNEYWSQQTEATFTTKACPPFRPPKTDVGGFEIRHASNHTRYVFVYWQPLREEEHNGDEFKYKIDVYADNESHTPINSVTTKEIYARFKIDLNAYRIAITSTNIEGAAKNSSYLRIPGHRSHANPISYVYSKLASPKVHTVSWSAKNGIEEHPITNFTLFWCRVEENEWFPCRENLQWEHINVKTWRYNVTANANHKYWFAISANYAQWSSGIQRGRCTEKLYTNHEIYIDAVASDHVNVSWSLSCDNSVNTGYHYSQKIVYCILDRGSNGTTSCSSQIKNITLDSSARSYQFRNLSFYTTLRISVFLIDEILFPTLPLSMFYDKSHGKVMATTSEGPPDMTDVRIRVLDVTSLTAEIEWDVPKIMNGVLRHYSIVYGYGNRSTEMRVNETRCQLRNLQGYKKYNVTLRACTVACSKAVGQTLRTKIGSPSSVEVDYDAISNEMSLQLRWRKPKTPNGPNPMYELIKREKISNRSTSQIVKETNASIEALDCSDPRWSYTFMVRALNNDSESGTGIHYGQWSSLQPIDCKIFELASFPTSLFVYAYLVFLIFFAILLIYSIIKFRVKLRIK